MEYSPSWNYFQFAIYIFLRIVQELATDLATIWAHAFPDGHELVVTFGSLHEDEPGQYFYEKGVDPLGHFGVARSPVVDVENDDSEDEGKSDNDKRKKQVLPNQWNDQWRRRHDVHNQKKKQGQRQQYRNGQRHLKMKKDLGNECSNVKKVLFNIHSALTSLRQCFKFKLKPLLMKNDGWVPFESPRILLYLFEKVSTCVKRFQEILRPLKKD